jgi:MSHA pilin protein MshD
MRTTKTRQTGFTLIEMIIFIVIVSAALAGILSVMNTVVKSSADPMVRKQAIALADSVLEEVLQKAYCDPDPLVTTGETTRETMDDVMDFDTKTNALFSSGTYPIPAALLAMYTITIAVTSDTTTLGTAPNIPAKKVMVTVAGLGESVSMTGFRARYGDDTVCAP